MTSSYAYALIFLCISIEVSPSVSQLLGGGDLLPGLGDHVNNGLLPDIPKCLASVLNVPGCVEEIITSFLSIQPRLIGPQCCKAALEFEDNCLPKIFPLSSLFPFTLRSFCPNQGTLPRPSPQPLVPTLARKFVHVYMLFIIFVANENGLGGDPKGSNKFGMS
ncbi:hypothetical protein RND71_002818 [Anisodus tanguticus]|uniref:Prolamin-like domain-containing protein n=1 Tax=Anisodus tanguticus TaxID=243964 RepID=A0AAE1VPF6_9SOLA|nr:hypothetical protein RND71_002818 [Anisodus tanguticus]